MAVREPCHSKQEALKRKLAGYAGCGPRQSGRLGALPEETHKSLWRFNGGGHRAAWGGSCAGTCWRQRSTEISLSSIQPIAASLSCSDDITAPVAIQEGGPPRLLATFRSGGATFCYRRTHKREPLQLLFALAKRQQQGLVPCLRRGGIVEEAQAQARCLAGRLKLLKNLVPLLQAGRSTHA